MPTRNPPRIGAYLLLVSAIAGLVLAVYNYYKPLSGVSYTWGALLVIIVSALISVLTIIAVIPTRDSRRWRGIAWRVLILILLGGCCFAGALLHEWWLCIAMIVGAFGLCVDAFATFTLAARHKHQVAGT